MEDRTCKVQEQRTGPHWQGSALDHLHVTIRIIPSLPRRILVALTDVCVYHLVYHGLYLIVYLLVIVPIAFTM